MPNWKYLGEKLEKISNIVRPSILLPQISGHNKETEAIIEEMFRVLPDFYFCQNFPSGGSPNHRKNRFSKIIRENAATAKKPPRI